MTGFVSIENKLDNRHNIRIRLFANTVAESKLLMSAIGTSVCVVYGLCLLLGGLLRLHGFRDGCHGYRRADHGRASDRAEQVVKGSFHSGASR